MNKFIRIFYWLLSLNELTALNELVCFCNFHLILKYISSLDLLQFLK